jgi:tripartite-type tricarboxylate transporter receptor subunit TctC
MTFQFIRSLRGAVLSMAALGAGFAAVHAPASAQDFPSRPIKFIVPFSPGGSSDLVARLLAKDAEKYLGQPLVIENKPGAAAMIGLNELVQSRPDGYTIGITNSGMVTQPLYGIAKYNYVTDLQPLAQVGEVPFVLCVKADSEFKTLEDFIAYAKANPKAISYGITGIGNTSHIGPEHLKFLAKFPMEAVNFSGGGELMTSLLGGHIQAGGINPVDIREQVKAGKIRVLALFGEKRMTDPLFANVPTAKERGYNVVVTLWQGIGAPKNMPEAVRAKLAGAFEKILATKETQDALRGLGLEPVYMGPADFSRKWVDEQAHYKQVVTETGIMQLVRSQTK